ncbi:MAG: Rrf2 family transcriptional regulator [Chitinophagales bacterium]|nr:Rrf2 family transcriptional regulator [Chitinophagales bacterium]MCZ2392296.1 Rrf2 family transcriptional regulator [Chitinophagales bacterium]
MFSKACEYAIRAIIYIAEQTKSGNRPPLKDIALEIDSPEAFTAKILQQLSKNGLVFSIKGVYGGFEIQPQKLDTIRLVDIVLAIDGDDVYTKCALGLRNCSEEHPCPVHPTFKPIKADIRRMLEETSIWDMSESFKNGKSFLKV